MSPKAAMAPSPASRPDPESLSHRNTVQPLHKIVTFLLEAWGWARAATLGCVEREALVDGYRVSVVRRPGPKRAAFHGRIRGAWARFAAEEIRGLGETELLELVSRRLTAALERIGVTPMKRKTVWINRRWCVTAVYTP